MSCAIAKAWSRISPSMTRRSRLMRSSAVANSVARARSSVQRHSIPKVISAKRPAALIRGPNAKPKSCAVHCALVRPAATNKADIPAGITPLRMRANPCATKRRLLASSLTTSATVPNATKGKRLSSLGCDCASHTPRVRCSARNASNT